MEFKFVLVDALFDVILSVAEHAIDQSSEMVSHGNDCFGSAESAFKAAVFCSERALAISEALGAKSQSVSRSIVDFAGGTM